MKEFNNIFKKNNKNKEEQKKIKEDFQKLLKSPNKTFDEKLKLWEKAPSELKMHYKKLPSCKNIKIRAVFNEIKNQLFDSGRIVDLSIGLMDDLYIYHKDEYEEAFESKSHLKTQKEFISFMNFVFKYNIGSYE